MLKLNIKALHGDASSTRTLSHLAADLIIFILKGNKVAKRSALGGSRGRDKQRGMRGGEEGRKMERELGGRWIWTGGNEERGNGCKEVEGKRARMGWTKQVRRRAGWKEGLMISCVSASREMHTYAPDHLWFLHNLPLSASDGRRKVEEGVWREDWVSL